MNISAVSFGKTVSGYERNCYRTSSKQRSYSDTYERRAPQKKPVKKQGFRLPKTLAGFLSGIVVAATVSQCSQTDIPKPITVPIDPETSITEMAEIYNTTPEIILSYNNVNNEAELEELDEVKVPVSYDYTQEKIEKLQEKLYSDDLSMEERDELEEEIAVLQAKQEKQQEFADVYSDGKYIYYNIKDTEDSEYGYQSMNVENFKELFDIKDEVIRKHNDISYTWDKDNYDFGGSYKDYTTASIGSGRVIKIPVSGIKK